MASRTASYRLYDVKTAQFWPNTNGRSGMFLNHGASYSRAGTAGVRHSGPSKFQQKQQRLEVQRPRTIRTDLMKMP